MTQMLVLPRNQNRVLDISHLELQVIVRHACLDVGVLECVCGG